VAWFDAALPAAIGVDLETSARRSTPLQVDATDAVYRPPVTRCMVLRAKMRRLEP
jgi:hypothetical protein